MSIPNKFTIQNSFAIRAGAGSGKTYTLSRRTINAILGFDFFRESPEQPTFIEDYQANQTEVHEIVTITYTEAAALEMKERIFSLMKKVVEFESLNDEDGDKPSIHEAYSGLKTAQAEYVRERLGKALEKLQEARISTIHSYCLELLRSNSDLCQIDGQIAVVREDEQKNLIQDAYHKVLNDTALEPDLKILRESTSLFRADQFIHRYVTDSKFRERLGSFTPSDPRLKDELLAWLKVFHYQPSKAILDEAEAICKEFPDEEKLAAMVDFLESLKTFGSQPFKVFINGNFTQPKCLEEGQWEIIKQARKRGDAIAAVYAIDPDREAQFAQVLEAFKAIAEAVRQHYVTQLKAEEKTDFDAIIQSAKSIIDQTHQTCRYMMVDEFQDTNLMQWEIITQSLGSDGDLFVVGDEKQSIYSFQGAEIEVFKQALESDRFTGTVEMETNYRSDKQVLKFVNVLFEKLLKPIPLETTQDGKQLNRNFNALFQKLSHHKKAAEGSASFFLSLKKSDEDEGQDEFEALAWLIHQIKEGMLPKYANITDKMKAGEKAIGVLFDSKSKMYRLREALKHYAIPCKISAGENLYDSKEVSDLFHVMMALHIIHTKSNLDEMTKVQNYYLTGAMRSHILQIPEPDILLHLDNHTIPEPLQAWALKADQLGLAQLAHTILSDSCVHSVYAHLDEYEQREANLNAFLQMCVQFEQDQGNDLGAFLRQMESLVIFKAVEETEAYFISPAIDSVELCSIHSTKGLECPMVILADSSKPLSLPVVTESIKFNTLQEAGEEQPLSLAGMKMDGYEPLSRRVIKEIDKLKADAEKRRLLYVALTRAANHLVISGSVGITLKETKEKTEYVFTGGYSAHALSDGSYLHRMFEALGVKAKDLEEAEEFTQIAGWDFWLPRLDKLEESVPEPPKLPVTQHLFKELEFTTYTRFSATMDKGTIDSSDKAKKSAAIGTLTHKMLELH